MAIPSGFLHTTLSAAEGQPSKASNTASDASATVMGEKAIEVSLCVEGSPVGLDPGRVANKLTMPDGQSRNIDVPDMVTVTMGFIRKITEQSNPTAKNLIMGD